MRVFTVLTLAALGTAPFASVGADFDGSKTLICAPVEALDCMSGQQCARGIPAEIGAPPFMRIDFSKRAVIGPKRTSKIVSMEKEQEQILLQGTELGYGWTLVLNQADGGMTASLADRTGVFVLFGSCTPL
jgi:hypothetical protein